MEIGINNPRWLLAQQVRKELLWWNNKIIRNNEIPAAIENGDLIRVPNSGETYRLVHILRSEQEPPLARPETVLAINEAGRRWREKIRQNYSESRDANRFFLSVFSLYRDEKLQHQLHLETINANDLSTHQAGAAADLDPNGFYYLDSKRFLSINPRSLHPTIPPSMLPLLTKFLKQTLSKMKEEGLINFIAEYKPRRGQRKSTLSCFHISPNPNFFTIQP